jgi:hypothetical protein
MYIQHSVIYFRQETDHDCWKAALRMLYGGPVTFSFEGVEFEGKGGLKTNYCNMRRFAAACGLQLHVFQSHTLEAFGALLLRGPLMLCGFFAPYGNHAFIVGGMAGEQIDILDPQSQRFSWSYSDFMARCPAAGAYILHR